MLKEKSHTKEPWRQAAVAALQKDLEKAHKAARLQVRDKRAYQPQKDAQYGDEKGLDKKSPNHTSKEP